MSSEISAAFLLAQEAALTASAALAAAFAPDAAARVFVGAPVEGARLPYLVIGDNLVTGIGPADGCVEGADVLARVHVRHKSTKPREAVLKVSAIAQAVVAALDVELAITGYRVVVHEFESTVPLTDPDGSTHYVVSLAYQIHATA